MDPFAVASLVSAGSQFLGGVTSAFGASKQLSQRDAMQAQSEFNLAQHKQSLLNTPSWEMAGLKKAGINPLLRYGQHGSPNPSTAQGVSQAPSVNKLQGLGEGISNMANSAMDAYKTVATVDQMEAQINKIGEEILNLGTQRGVMTATEANTRQQTAASVQQMALTAADILLRGEQHQQVTTAIRNADMEYILMQIRERLLLNEERIGARGAQLADLGVGWVLDLFTLGNTAADAITSTKDDFTVTMQDGSPIPEDVTWFDILVSPVTGLFE